MAEGTGRTLSANEKKKFDFGSWIIIYISAAMFIFLSVTRSNFFNFSNIHSILYGVSFEFFAAVGFTLLIIMGELDMSVGSLYGFGGAMMGYFVFNYKLPVGISIPLAMALALIIGLCAGFLIVRFRLNSMMVTIGVMMAVKGFNWMMVNNFGGRQLPAAARDFVSVNLLNIRWSIWVMLIIAVVLEILLIKSWRFKQLYYIGHNMDTTILYGLRADRVKILCFGISAAMSAFGGCLMTARLARPDVTVGANLEIGTITAAVIGGASIFGGRGSIVRSMLGVFFIFLLQNGMTAYNINSYIQQIVVGTILVAAICLDLRFNKKRG